MKKKLISSFFILICFSGFVNVLNAENCFTKTCVSCPPSCDEGVCNSKCISQKTFYSFRPQDSNTVRRILNEYNNIVYSDDFYCAGFTLEYQKTFDNKKITDWFLFNNKQCLSIGIPGGGRSFDIDGNQVGLTTPGSVSGLIGDICFNPSVENYIIDFDFRFNLDRCVNGLWARLICPVVYTKTKLGLRQCGCNIGENTFFPKGFYVANCAATMEPFANILQAFEGNNAFGDVPSLCCGQFSSSSLTKSGIAGLHLDLGYDFVQEDCGYFGASLHVVIPTGTRPNGKFILEPIVGANKCWQIGFTTRGAIDLSNDYNLNNMGIYFDIILTHLFKSKQTRLFALKNNGPLSQLLLLKTFNSMESDVSSAERVANILCGETHIGSDLMLDASVMFEIERCGFFANIGYNLWIRTKEKRSDKVCFRNFAEEKYGLKGDLPLATQISTFICPNPSPIVICEPDLRTASRSNISRPGSTENDPVLLSIADIDFSAPLHPTAISNKIFATIGYNWDSDCYSGFAQIGGEAEFSNNNAALNQWGIILNFGIVI